MVFDLPTSATVVSDRLIDPLEVVVAPVVVEKPLVLKRLAACNKVNNPGLFTRLLFIISLKGIGLTPTLTSTLNSDVCLSIPDPLLETSLRLTPHKPFKLLYPQKRGFTQEPTDIVPIKKAMFVLQEFTEFLTLPPPSSLQGTLIQI
eukprot:7249739-Ditylum_brightwellii.AAC.1